MPTFSVLPLARLAKAIRRSGTFVDMPHVLTQLNDIPIYMKKQLSG